MIIEKIRSSSDKPQHTKFHQGMSVSMHGEQLLITGGNDNGTLVRSFTSIDTISHTRSTLTDLPFSVTDHCSCVFQNRLYVFGGLRSDDSNDVVVFSFESDTWERLDITTTHNVSACFVHDDAIYIIDDDTVKILNKDHLLTSKFMHHYANRGNFVGVDSPKVYFDNLAFDISNGATTSHKPKFSPDEYTSIYYIDKVVGLPRNIQRDGIFKVVDDKELRSSDVSVGEHKHALLDHTIFSFNLKTNTWFKSFPLSEKTIAGHTPSLPVIDNPIKIHCVQDRIELAHYNGGKLTLDTLDLRTMDYKTSKTVPINAKSFSKRPSFNMLDTRIAHINEETYAYGGMGLHYDTGKLNGYLYELTDPKHVFVDIEPRKDHQVNSYDNSLIVTGGRGDRIYNHVYKVNPKDGSVIRLKRLPISGLYDHVSDISNNTLVVAGGKDSSHNSNSHVFAYNMSTNKYQIYENVTKGVVFDVIAHGAKTYILSHLKETLFITCLSNNGDINIKTTKTQLKAITNGSAGKLDSNNILLVLTGTSNYNDETIIYRLGLK